MDSPYNDNRLIDVTKSHPKRYDHAKYLNFAQGSSASVEAENRSVVEWDEAPATKQ